MRLVENRGLGLTIIVNLLPFLGISGLNRRARGENGQRLPSTVTCHGDKRSATPLWGDGLSFSRISINTWLQFSETALKRKRQVLSRVPSWEEQMVEEIPVKRRTTSTSFRRRQRRRSHTGFEKQPGSGGGFQSQLHFSIFAGEMLFPLRLPCFSGFNLCAGEGHVGSCRQSGRLESPQLYIMG